MKILLITDSYPPEIRSASHLMLELAEELITRGYEVAVATTWPQYNLDELSQNKSFPEFTTENNVKVLRIKTLPHHKVNFIIRGVAQLLMPWLFLGKIKKYNLHLSDAVIVYSPPLPLALVGAWLRRNNCPFVLSVQDLFPQNAIDLGILKNKALIYFFKLIERYVYQKAHIVTAHSDGNCLVLQKQHPEISEKFITLHNWVDIDHHHENTSNKDFKKIFGIENKFIAIFAGVIGPSQNLDILLHAAERLKEYDDLLILIVGDGSEKKRLQEKAERLNLKNVMFHPFVSREDYPALLSICHIGIVSLSSKNKTPVVPGKILGYMANSLPVMAFLNKESDGHRLIAEAKCGYSTVSDDLNGIVDAFRKSYLHRDELLQIGKFGFKYVSENFSKETCISKIESLLYADRNTYTFDAKF